MAGTPVCLVCKKEMERGFLVDHTDAGPTLPRWCPGTPKDPPTWLGIKVGEMSSAQAQSGLVVVAYRCPECEALRLYAPAAPKP